jgi:hypothetical protein
LELHVVPQRVNPTIVTANQGTSAKSIVQTKICSSYDPNEKKKTVNLNPAVVEKHKSSPSNIESNESSISEANHTTRMEEEEVYANEDPPDLHSDVNNIAASETPQSAAKNPGTTGQLGDTGEELSHDNLLSSNCTVNATLNESVGGNDRVSEDQPPKEALVTNSSKPATHQLLAENPTPKINSENRSETGAMKRVAMKDQRVDSTVQSPPAATDVLLSKADVSQYSSPSTKIETTARVMAVDNEFVVSSAPVSISDTTSTVEKLNSAPVPLSTKVVPTERLGSQTNELVSSSVVAHQTAYDARLPAASFQQAAQQAAEEEAIAVARAPLVNLYGSYLCHSKDSSLSDARSRLRTAITQTRSLRQTFTERVYGKYRVCLRPPPTAEEIITRIEADPVGQLRKLKEEIATIREEKEIEKKEAGKLNSEMNQSGASDRVPVLTNIDNAEQLMFLTAGLNLVILPEEPTDLELLREYTERFTTNSSTGQRIRSSISQAAATAGEVILDRTRKAAAMRVERQRRRQLQLLRGEVVADGESESNYSRLQVLAIAGSSATHGIADRVNKSHSSTSSGATKSTSSSTRRNTTTTSKGGRSRTQTSLPTNTLLGLNPTAEEVKCDDKPSASTAALMARGVGLAAAKTTQQRLRHPHPESLGGRRRANMNPGVSRKDDEGFLNQPEPFLQSYLANTLPPLPASKERLERKRLPDEMGDTPASRTARDSIKFVLSHFLGKSKDQISMSVSKIRLLNGLRKQYRVSYKSKQSISTRDSLVPASDTDATAQDFSQDATTETQINPALTMSVLHALGIVGRSQPYDSRPVYSAAPELNLDNKALCSDKLTALKGKIVSFDTKLTRSIFLLHEGPRSMEVSRKRTRSTNTAVAESPKKISRHEDLDTAVAKIRDVELLKKENVAVDSDVAAVTKTVPAVHASSDSAQPKKRKRSASSPTRLSAAVPQMPSDKDHVQVPSGGAQNIIGTAPIGTDYFGQSAAMNVFHLANQLNHMHHPAAGDLAAYLGSFQIQPQGYDLPTFVSGTFSSQLAALGFMQPTTNFAGYSLQEGAAAARAMLLREQQAAAILDGYPMQAAGVFPQVVPHQYLMAQNVPEMESNRDIPVSVSKPDECLPAESLGDYTKNPISGGTKTPYLNPMDSGEIIPTASEKPRANSATIAINREVGLTQDAASIDDDRGPIIGKTSGFSGSGGMQFTAPTAPSSIRTEHVELVLSGLFHAVAAGIEQSDFGETLDYLLLVGASVPLPKSLVLGPLKERLNTPGFKSAGSNCAPAISRDIVASIILVWLWATHEHTFQRAFTKNGRIDVDSDCKWLVQAAVDTAVDELSLEIAESMARGEGAFAEASTLRKDNPTTLVTGSSSSQVSVAARKLDMCTACIVSKALTAEMCVNDDMDSVIPIATILVDFLDEARLGALRAKSEERVLLATLIARKTLMSESFAHAYVSSMVRAGEAIKHGRLFEIVQDEEVLASTMVPYDIFTDDTGAWEDPCKPDDCFTEGLSGDELTRRAHARAMIQKSLRKLQDRHHIRGGTSIYGPFVDSTSDLSYVNNGTRVKDRPSLVPQRSGLKRRASSMIEPPVVPGTGSAAAKSWAVYHPRHFSSPLEWDPDDAENLPYGLHPRNDRIRFLSVVNPRRSDHHNGASGLRRSTSITIHQSSPSYTSNVESCLHRSTHEIDWGDIASTFQSVELQRKSTRYKLSEPETPAALDGTIFAPFFCEVQDDLSSDDTESETEEDLTEATVLSRHQVVLDGMKAKLEAYLEARKQQQERRKNKYAK